MRWRLSIFDVCFTYIFINQKTTKFRGLFIHTEALFYVYIYAQTYFINVYIHFFDYCAIIKSTIVSEEQ